MSQKETVEIWKELHSINFDKDGIIYVSNNYDNFDDLIIKGDIHLKHIEGCCQECDKVNPAYITEKPSKDTQNYKLMRISHGSHSFDFFCTSEELKRKYLEAQDLWTSHPVIFIFENPSLSYDLYDDSIDNKTRKHPAKSWYWIHNSQFDDEKYPENFSMKKYGELFFSIVNTFKLENAYLTNMVKCGMSCSDNSKNKNFLSTTSYNPEIIRNCTEKFLIKEIEILSRQRNDITVFCFGDIVFSQVTKLLSTLKLEKCQVCKLPHPARIMSNEDRKVLLFSKMFAYLRPYLKPNQIDIDFFFDSIVEK